MQVRKNVNASVGLLAALVMGVSAAPVMAAGSNDTQFKSGTLIVAAADEQHRKPDAWITTKVKAKLLEQNFKTGVNIKVTTEDGVVQLAGFVNKAEQVSLAENIAANVEGVKRVQNDLIIK